MKIEHIAIWTRDLEALKEFYERIFGASVGTKYVNKDRGFESYFLNFDNSARLEIMTTSNLISAKNIMVPSLLTGYAHFAFSVGSKEGVDSLTERIKVLGYRVADGPRFTGDGYYESVILDPDGNRVEITI